jgi:hypothetical protein
MGEQVGRFRPPGLLFAETPRRPLESAGVSWIAVRRLFILALLVCLGAQMGLTGLIGIEPCALAETGPSDSGTCAPFCATCACCATHQVLAVEAPNSGLAEAMGGEVTRAAAAPVPTGIPSEIWHIPLV